MWAAASQEVTRPTVLAGGGLYSSLSPATVTLLYSSPTPAIRLVVNSGDLVGSEDSELDIGQQTVSCTR